MPACIRRRLLFASSQAYEPELETVRRTVGWLAPPIVVRRVVEFWHRPIDLAMVGRVAEGVVVAFRGSLAPFGRGPLDELDVLLDWMNDGLSLCRNDPAYGGRVHWGFAESMRRLWTDADGASGVARAIERQLAAGAARRLYFTGHSKGGALANLAALRAAHVPEWRDVPIHVQTIAAARAGDAAFARAYAAERIDCVRYEAPLDLVPHLPLGPGTPPWVRTVARTVLPWLARGDYHSVGRRVPEHGSAKQWLGEWLGHLHEAVTAKNFDLGEYTPSMIAAHGLSPGSTYDRLVCDGVACSHGQLLAA